MRHRAGILITLFLAIQAPLLDADAYRTGHPGSAYPPSCIDGTLRHLDLNGENIAMFFSERVWLEVAHKIESNDPYDNLGEVQLDMYRVGCSEPNRSVIVAEFTLPPEWVDPRKSQLLLPWLGGNTGFDPYPLVWKAEANAWGGNPGQLRFTSMAFGDFTGGWSDPRRFSWRYVLDVPPPGGIGGRDAAPQYYNGDFAVLFHRSTGEHFFTISIPATEAVLGTAARLPLNGRLSGNWVEKGALDQGFLISINSMPRSGSLPGSTEGPQLVMFLSWFTFDAQGDLLWLTGAATFLPDSSEALVPIEAVRNGTFLGGSAAQRSFVGSARLSVLNCNRIELEYQLNDLGLGSDIIQLQRLFALEIADYPCRDYEGLQSSIYPVYSK